MKSILQKMKRRAAVEPTIGHLKTEHRLDRNPLGSTLRDSINAILSAAAMNFGKLMGFLWPILFQLLESLLPTSPID